MFTTWFTKIRVIIYRRLDKYVKKEIKEVNIMYKKYDISLRDEIESHVLGLNYKDHNLSFTNMFLWKDKFKLNVYVNEDFLIVFSTYKGELFSLNPICLCSKIDLAVDFLIEYFAKENKPFIIHNCVRTVKEAIENKYGDYFTYESTRDSFDYLYEVEKIMTYSGKKLQKKRNHVNNFLKAYEGVYEVKEINNQEIVNDCIAYTNYWADNKEVKDEYLPDEVNGTIDVLNHFTSLSCEGLAIYIDDKIVGFAVGTQLNDTTAVINIEKAEAEIVGLYPFLRQQVVSTFFDDLKYINTEDDVGDENLRKSKLSYRPEYLVEKFTITRNDEN